MRYPFSLLALLLASGCLLSCVHHRGSNDSNIPLPGSDPNGSSNLAAIVHPRSAQDYQFWEALNQARVIYISETHDDENHHEYQFDVLRGLHARGVPFAIGWEMFAFTHQNLLDQWQNGRISLETVFAKVGWKSNWGKESPSYEKMLRWSRSVNIPNVALNAPDAISKKVAFGQTLSGQENALLPGGFRSLPGGSEHFAEQMAQNPHAGTLTPEGFQNFYRAQTVWDQTMAQRVVDFVMQNPQLKLVVIIGRGHVEGGYGVPAYVKQKMNIRQLVLYPGESAESIPAPRLAFCYD